jgi:tetratricopeptide (TPR) repeat protein
LVVVLLLGASIYRHFSRPTIVGLPDVNVAGIDPAVKAAVEEARSRVQQSPRSADAWGKFGMVLLVHDFQAEAVVCLGQAERLDPREPRWPYYQALEALLRTDLQRARTKLERAVALSGDQFDGPRLVLAETLLGLEDLDEAQRQFLILIERNSRNSKASLGLARIAVKRGDLRGSLEPLSLIQSSPFARQAASELLAEVQQQLADPAKAEAARRRAAELPPDQNWPDPLRDELAALRTGKANRLRQAAVHDREGDHAEALTLLQGIVLDYPDADDAWLAFGKALFDRKMLPQAEAALRRAVSLAPTMPEPVNELGRVLAAQGNRGEAAKYFRKALELRPNFALAWHNLGSCLIGMGERDAAVDAFSKAVRYAPDMFDSQLTLALLLAEKGQTTEALAHAQQAVRLKPNYPPAQKLLEQLKKEQASSKPNP